MGVGISGLGVKSGVAVSGVGDGAIGAVSKAADSDGWVASMASTAVSLTAASGTLLGVVPIRGISLTPTISLAALILSPSYGIIASVVFFVLAIGFLCGRVLL